MIKRPTMMCLAMGKKKQKNKKPITTKLVLLGTFLCFRFYWLPGHRKVSLNCFEFFLSSSTCSSSTCSSCSSSSSSKSSILSNGSNACVSVPVLHEQK